MGYLLKFYTLLFFIVVPTVVFGQAVCTITATTQSIEENPFEPTSTASADDCGVEVPEELLGVNLEEEEPLGLFVLGESEAQIGFVRMVANTLDATTRTPSLSPNLCSIRVESELAFFDGITEEVPLIDGSCAARLAFELPSGQFDARLFSLSAVVEIDNPDAESFSENSGNPSAEQVLALEKVVVENCRSESDSSVGCTNARSELLNATGRDGSGILIASITRLENIVIGNCSGRADESEECLESRESLFDATGRRGLRLIENILERRVIENCNPRFPPNGPRSIQCIQARIAFFNETGRTGFGLTRRNRRDGSETTE